MFTPCFLLKIPKTMASLNAPLHPSPLRQDELLALLEAYAAAENEDHFMVPCLRRALVPLPQAMDPKHDARWGGTLFGVFLMFGDSSISYRIS
jgi:hypothetical protein